MLIILIYQGKEKGPAYLKQYDPDETATVKPPLMTTPNVWFLTEGGRFKRRAKVVPN